MMIDSDFATGSVGYLLLFRAVCVLLQACVCSTTPAERHVFSVQVTFFRKNLGAAWTFTTDCKYFLRIMPVAHVKYCITFSGELAGKAEIF